MHLVVPNHKQLSGLLHVRFKLSLFLQTPADTGRHRQLSQCGELVNAARGAAGDVQYCGSETMDKNMRSRTFCSSSASATYRSNSCCTASKRIRCEVIRAIMLEDSLYLLHGL